MTTERELERAGPVALIKSDEWQIMLHRVRLRIMESQAQRDELVRIVTTRADGEKL